VRQSTKIIPTPSLERRFWIRVPSRPDEGCWNWSAAAMNAYGQLWVGPKYAKSGAHRVSWVIHFGEIPEGLCVCHHCDNKRCVRPDHLYLGTIGDNNRDAWERGLCEPIRHRVFDQTGEKGPGAKLTWEQVNEMRARYAAGGTSYSRLARQYGVSAGHIGGIIRRKFWPILPVQES
jgi:hypothetical protein